MKEVMDNTVTVIKNTISATPIDKDRLLVGTEDGLFCVDLERDGKQPANFTRDNLLCHLQKYHAWEMGRRSIRWSTYRRSSGS